MKMNVRSIVFHKPWMDDEGQELVRSLDRAIEPPRRSRRDKDDAIAVLLKDCVIVSYLVVRQIEIELLSHGDPAGTRDGADAKKDAKPALREALGKAEDRLRKAMKDYEEYVIRTAGAAGVGLADRMKPILKQADGALNEMLDDDPADDETTSGTSE